MGESNVDELEVLLALCFGGVGSGVGVGNGFGVDLVCGDPWVLSMGSDLVTLSVRTGRSKSTRSTHMLVHTAAADPRCVCLHAGNELLETCDAILYSGGPRR